MLPGFKQYTELPAYYGLAEAFVHLSRIEPWGLVVNEAMSVGLPVVVSRECGCANAAARRISCATARTVSSSRMTILTVSRSASRRSQIARWRRAPRWANAHARSLPTGRPSGLPVAYAQRPAPRSTSGPRASVRPGARLRIAVLRAFGARIGIGVVIKPSVKVKFPWRLTIGAHSWIGEEVWIDNLAEVAIGAHCCISHGAYLCTGSHDWSKPGFDLITRPIEIGDEAWICAKACVGPGVRVARGAVLTLGSVTSNDLAAWTRYASAAASPVHLRRDRPETDESVRHAEKTG